MTAVELHMAYVFTCEECGQDTFGRLRVLEPENAAQAIESGEAEYLREYVGTEEVVAYPVQVRCGYCLAVFDSVPLGVGDVDDEGGDA
jgi:hypothetical protein